VPPSSGARLNGSTNVAQYWLLKRRPRLLFSYAAAVTTMLFVLGIIANVLLAYQGTIAVPEALPFKIFGVLLGVMGALAALWLWVGMCWYWMRLDRSSRRSKILWFVILLFGNWVGATAYYFLVYQRKAEPSTVSVSS
jgi:Phospholipase_D-nuclease N-terminal